MESKFEEATHLRMSFPFPSLFSYGFAPRAGPKCRTAWQQLYRQLKLQNKPHLFAQTNRNGDSVGQSVGGIRERSELEKRMSQYCERNYAIPQFTLELYVREIDPKQHDQSFEN